MTTRSTKWRVRLRGAMAPGMEQPGANRATRTAEKRSPQVQRLW
jgi:hypothetical protein